MTLTERLDKAAVWLGLGKKAPAPRHMRGPAAAAIGLLALNWVIGLTVPERSGAASVSAILMMVAILISSWVSWRGPIVRGEADSRSDLVKAAYWRSIGLACLIILALLMFGIFGVAMGSWTLSSSIASHVMLSLVVLQGALPALTFSPDIDPAD